MQSHPYASIIHSFSMPTGSASEPSRTDFFSLPALQELGFPDLHRLPVSIRIVLESVVRHCDGDLIRTEHVAQLANWQSNAPRTDEIPFVVARVVLQDFTGVPLLTDLAAMRTTAATMGFDPKRIEPLVPVDLVIDHSVMVDYQGSEQALNLNMDKEFERNTERYQFLKWGMQAFKKFKVIPPGIGIVHQVNLEYLCRGVHHVDGVYFPDTLVGTDSHTTMINGLGVVGWGVGGIEAESAMLGQPVYLLTPDVVGVELVGELSEGVTATDLVLTLTQMLRAAHVVDSFVEFFGSGAASLSVTDRATIANMAPEYGATMGYFPIDDKTVAYLRNTGRSEAEVNAFEAYYRAQNLFGMPQVGEIDYSRTLRLDLNTVVPSIAGPKRPQDRIALPDVARQLDYLMRQSTDEGGFNLSATQVTERYIVDSAQGAFSLGHGDVVLAAITSCTNTSNPNVMLAAGLLAKKAVEKGLRIAPHIKTSLAPGSRVVAEYLMATGLQTYLDQLGFQVVAYGCTTCIGNSGELAPEITECIVHNQLITAAVLSGNRNFEARIQPNIKANFLASPPLVLAYALAGRMNIDLTTEPLGMDSEGMPVLLKDIWPSNDEVKALLSIAFNTATFQNKYRSFAQESPLWNAIQTPTGEVYTWPESTYIAQPPFFDDFALQPRPISGIEHAKALLIVGDSVTTDHISPAGSFKADTPAGEWLTTHGIGAGAFNSYGSRRGHFEVMVRGTFANVRLRNLMLPAAEDGGRIEGGFTLYEGVRTSIFDAAAQYRSRDIPTIVFAGTEYGTGSSRDWAAKGSQLLGIRAVIACSFERIHRANLVGMGILPLQFVGDDSVTTLNIGASDTFDILGVDDAIVPQQMFTLCIRRADGSNTQTEVRCRIDTPIEVDYYRHGGILPFVLRQILTQ